MKLGIIIVIVLVLITLVVSVNGGFISSTPIGYV